MAVRLLPLLAFGAVAVATFVIPRVALAQEFECKTATDVEAMAVLADAQVIHDLRGPDALSWIAMMNGGLTGVQVYGDRAMLSTVTGAPGTAVSVLTRGCVTAIVGIPSTAAEMIVDAVLGQQAEQ